jgi:hypothetical protein
VGGFLEGLEDALLQQQEIQDSGLAEMAQGRNFACEAPEALVDFIWDFVVRGLPVRPDKELRRREALGSNKTRFYKQVFAEAAVASILSAIGTG